MALCKQFNIVSTDLVAGYREFFSNPRTTAKVIEERLLKGFLNLIQVSSPEAERYFSQMNLICTKTALLSSFIPSVHKHQRATCAFMEIEGISVKIASTSHLC